jgi:hypothetical protein
MSRGGGAVTGPSTTWAAEAGAREMDWAVVVVTGAGRTAVVVVGRGAVVVGAAVKVVVVGAPVVVVVDGAVVEEAAIGNSVAATCIESAAGGAAGVAPTQVAAPTSTAARSGLATTGFRAIARIAG